MREVLFRGKSIDNGKWVQGYLYRFWDHAYILWGMIGDVPDSKEVDTETVCQYTGLTDKNGRQIFEGDIVIDHFDDSIMGIVRYGEYRSMFSDDAFTGHVGFYIEWQKRKNVIRKDLGYWVRNSEFVGNIFDNPELIGDC